MGLLGIVGEPWQRLHVLLPEPLLLVALDRGAGRLERSVADLERHASELGRPEMFEVFARYDLADEGETRPTYTAIASALNLTAATVTNHLAAMRRQFRTIVLDRLRELTSSDEEWEAEAAKLLGRRR